MAEPQAVKLGALVQDTITGYKGIVIAKTEWLNHCWRICVQSQELKDGKPVDAVTFDVEQLRVLETAEEKPQPAKRPGGDRPDTSRRADPDRGR